MLLLRRRSSSSCWSACSRLVQRPCFYVLFEIGKSWGESSLFVVFDVQQHLPPNITCWVVVGEQTNWWSFKLKIIGTFRVNKVYRCL